jgi:hypothetical protein
MDFVEAMKAAEAGLSTWREKPHNAKWWSRIDGTPIPNDGQIMWMPLHREHARAALAGLMVYPIANLPAETC